MSRVIKFRCWNAFANHMHGWNEMVEKNKIHLLSNENKSYVCEQFTGLTDKNGVEIYEGDLVTAGIRGGNVLSTYSIEYNSIYGCWYGNLINSQKIGNVDCIAIGELRFNAEVIGNIHQNPELIKE